VGGGGCVGGWGVGGCEVVMCCGDCMMHGVAPGRVFYGVCFSGRGDITYLLT